MADDRHCDLECKHHVRNAVIGLRFEQQRSIRGIRTQDMSRAITALYAMVEHFEVIEAALKREVPS